MEHSLTCNNLKCRKELGDRALVTTCSHIFCLDCVHDLGIAKQDGPRGTACPACNAQLSKPDDAVIANLNPSEDYKTSVLSGLSPNVVMECAGRALSFWAYQTTQEIYYQQYLYKTLTEKYSSLNLRLEQTVGDANAEIERLQNKVNACEAESEIMRRKHEELAHAYKDKSRKLLQTQELYDRVRRRVEMGQIERAASDAVDSSLNAPPRESAHRQRHGPAPELDVAAPDSYDNRIDMCSFGRGVPAATSQATADSTGWPGAGIPLQPGMFYASGGLDARHRFGLASQLGNRSHETRETAAPLVMGSRRGIIPSTSDLCQERGSLSGVGLSSGLKVSQPANITGLGASVRLQQ